MKIFTYKIEERTNKFTCKMAFITTVSETNAQCWVQSKLWCYKVTSTLIKITGEPDRTQHHIRKINKLKQNFNHPNELYFNNEVNKQFAEVSNEENQG